MLIRGEKKNMIPLLGNVIFCKTETAVNDKTEFKYTKAMASVGLASDLERSPVT